MEWQPENVVSDQCGVGVDVCRSIRRLLNEGCTVPFICRYRTGQIDNSPPDVVREVQQTLCELDKVITKATHIIQQNARNCQLLQEIEHQQIHKSPEEIQVLRASIIPSSICQGLRRCTSVLDINVLTAPFLQRSRQTKADTARKLGLQTIVDSMFAGTGATYCLYENLAAAVPEASCQMSDIELGNAVLHLLSETIAKDPDTFAELKQLCNQIPPIIHSTRRVVHKKTSSSSLSTGDSARIQTPILQRGSVDARTYADYFDFHSNARSIQGHQVLAINRGEKSGVLSVTVEFPTMFTTRFESWCRNEKFRNLKNSEPSSTRVAILKDIVKSSVKGAWNKFIRPQLTKKIRAEVTKIAEKIALRVFAKNLRSLLLTPPLNLSEHRGYIMGIDPGFSNGCKVAVLTPTGQVVDTTTLCLHTGSQDKRFGQQEQLVSLIKCYDIGVVAVGDGVAARETEILLSQMCTEKDEVYVASKHPTRRPQFVSISEAGVSIWSVTPEAEKDLPDYKPNIRSAIAIARRLINPLGEYTKVDPQHLGIGMYQLDIPKNELESVLASVVEECVSLVGLDINSAPVHILKSISGLGSAKASAIVKFREANGPFVCREQLREVKGIGPKTFQQCAGFLRIRSAVTTLMAENEDVEMRAKTFTGPSDLKSTFCQERRRKKRNQAFLGESDKSDVSMKSSSSNSSRALTPRATPTFSRESSQNLVVSSNHRTPLDSTWIHPEHYGVAEWLITASGTSIDLFVTDNFKQRIKEFCSSTPIEKIINELQIDKETLELIVKGLVSQTGFIDIRDYMTAPLYRTEVLHIENLKSGMSLKGRVTNIVSFGAFIDVGVGVDGLLHRQRLNTMEHLIVGQAIDVKVLSVDVQRGRPRISLQLDNID